MKLKVTLLVLSALFITAGIFGGGYLLLKEDKVTVLVVSPVTKTNQPTSIPLTPPQSQTSQQPQSLQVLGDTQQVETPEPTPSLPQPSQFSVYEEHASSPGSLYIDIQQGEGFEAAPGDTVAVVYQGWLTNGELFDQSRVNEEGLIEPIIFKLGAGQVIAGWEQGIVGMKQGGRRRLIIPSSFGYGASGQGVIPGDAMLIFDVELTATRITDEPGL